MKNKNIPLKVAFWGNAVLVILMVVLGVELTSIAPFVLFSGLLAGMIWRDKNFKIALIVIAGLMAILNIMVSPIDVLAWIISLVLVII